MILDVFIVFVVLSIIWDAIVIEVLHKKITKIGHGVRWLFRASVGIYFISIDTSWPLIQIGFTYVITFWFLFDTGLNIMRGRALYYLGSSFLDKLQKNYPNEFVWFVFKAIAFIGLVGAYYFN
jgi:hypothetical protein